MRERRPACPTSGDAPQWDGCLRLSPAPSRHASPVHPGGPQRVKPMLPENGHASSWPPRRHEALAPPKGTTRGTSRPPHPWATRLPAGCTHAKPIPRAGQGTPSAAPFPNDLRAPRRNPRVDAPGGQRASAHTRARTHTRAHARARDSATVPSVEAALRPFPVRHNELARHRLPILTALSPEKDPKYILVGSSGRVVVAPVVDPCEPAFGRPVPRDS